MTDRLLRVAITHGDTNGIGYELIIKTFAEPETLEIMTPIIYGSVEMFNIYAEMLNINCRLNVIKKAEDACENRINIIEVCEPHTPVKLGIATQESAAAAAKSLERALTDARNGCFDTLVLAPTNKKDFSFVTSKFRISVPEEENPNNEEAEKAVAPAVPIVMTGNDTIMLATVTNSNDLQATADVIIERATTLRNALRRDRKIDCPRIAIMSYNDTIDASEGGTDKAIAEPAVAKLRENGVVAYGPLTEKEIFEEGKYMHFDGILCMHGKQDDAFYQKYFGDNGVRLISNLPIVVTAPLNEASFEIAGKGEADETSMRSAIYSAIDATRSRHYYDLARRNPLKKLFHERREDGDKARFINLKPKA